MTAVLAAHALAATLVCIAALVRLHTLRTGYDPLRDAVGDYGVGRHTGSLLLASEGIAIPWFPTDVDRSRRTQAGRIHLVLAAVAFRLDLARRGAASYFGLVERLFDVAMLAWFVTVSVELI